MGYYDQNIEIDNLAYRYFGNQLTYVDDINDDNHQNYGFKDIGAFNYVQARPGVSLPDYEYDPNGNLISDQNKQITEISYNHQNLPTNVKFYDYVSGEKNISYLYDANGTKLRMKSKNITDYVGNFVYENGELSFILMPEGRILLDNSTNSITVNYFLKDHLGNTRSIVSETGEVLEEDSYYPFGMLIVDEDLSNSTAEPDNRYKYNGKELTTDFGLDWYEYGFRMYDPQIGRFPSLDPKADEFAFVSPYNYAENSPIAFIDLWGLQAVNYEAAMAIGDPEGYLSYKENQVKAAQSTVNYLTNFGGEKRIAFSFKFTVGPQAGAKGTVGGISLGAEGGENTEVFTLEYEDIEEDSGVDGDCFNLNYISKEDENVVTDFGSFNFGTVGFGASKEEIINLNNGEKEVSETFSGNALIFSGDITKNSDGSETLNKNYIDIGLSIRAIWGVEIKFQVGKQK